MVDRILSNTFFSVQDLSQKCSSPYLPSLLKVPIPYDSANPLKRSIYLEMMPTVGKNPLWRRIWKSALGPAVQTGPQQSGTFITSLSCNPPKAERLALKAVLILFMVAHAEYLEDVTKQALSHPQWDHDVEELMKERNCETLEKARDLLLKEVVLRSQRNGFAYANVSDRFRKRVHGILDPTTCLNGD
eukprot:11016910-Prorocentrum_lima.AAC.1